MGESPRDRNITFIGLENRGRRGGEEEGQGQLIEVEFGGSQGEMPYVQSQPQVGKSTQAGRYVYRGKLKLSCGPKIVRRVTEGDCGEK